MRLEHKRQPAFEDTDNITFGRYKGYALGDVPPSYLRWLWEDGLKDFSRNDPDIPSSNTSLRQKVKLANYIWNSQDAISQELGEPFI